jgi:hypothetical protein
VDSRLKELSTKNNCPLDIPSDDLELLCTPRINDETYESKTFSPFYSSGNQLMILSSSTISPYRKTCEDQRIGICCKLAKREQRHIDIGF